MNSKPRDIVAKEMFIKAKEHEKVLTKHRCMKRINKIIYTINNELVGLELDTFAVSTSDRNQMISDVLKTITQWNGCKNYKKYECWEECHIKVVRAWWNRVKCWKLGDYVFGPITKLFFKFIINNNGINQTRKVTTFTNILMVLFHTKIQYPKSMARPIIPIQIFVKQNVFRDFCVKFVSDFGVKWQANGINNKYVPNPKRSQELFESYLNCLKSITFKITSMAATDAGIATDVYIPTIHPSDNPNIPPFPSLSAIRFNHQTPTQLPQFQKRQNVTNFSVSNIKNQQHQYQNNNYYNPFPQQCACCYNYGPELESQDNGYGAYPYQQIYPQQPNNSSNCNYNNQSNECFECVLSSYSQSTFPNFQSNQHNNNNTTNAQW